MSMKSKITVIVGDITTLSVDAIVNAANKRLLGGGGVDGAIHRAAGPQLLKECYTLGGCETGEAKITGAYGLNNVKSIIHTVGPIVSGPLTERHKEDLSACYRNALELVRRHKLRSVAFPCISTGVYSFPSEEAARIAITTTSQWLATGDNADAIDKIIYCVFHPEDKITYDGLIPKLLTD